MNFERKSSQYSSLELDLATTFAYVVLLESGNITLDSKGLKNVIAISSGDSLFVVSALLSDPVRKETSQIRHIRGNVGKAGITLLVPPQGIVVPKAQSHDWKFLDFKDFDGVITDSFKATILHMSFTDYVLPLDTRFRLRDVEVYLLETVISVHDKGEWVGDLDIIPFLKSPLLRVLNTSTACKHDRDNSIVEQMELVTLDSWKECLDLPDEPVVFRAQGNWMARLAASSMSILRGHLTIVFGDHVCWQCGSDERERRKHNLKPMFLL